MTRAWIAIIGCCVSGAAAAGEYQGAAKVLEALALDLNVAAPQESREALLAAIDDFKRVAASLPDEEAAKRWLALYDRLRAHRTAQDIYDFRQLFDRWAYSLPGPTTWPKLAEQLQARQPPVDEREAVAFHGLRLLIHTLLADKPASEQDIAALRELQKTAAADLPELITRALDPDGGEAYIPRSIAKTEDKLAPFRQWLDSDGFFSLDVPDLVTLVGREEAERLLRRAFKHPPHKFEPFPLRSVAGTETQALAREVALAMLDELAYAPWLLAQSLDAIPLYEGLVSRFGAPQDREGSLARGAYIAALVRADRLDDAKAAIRAIDPSPAANPSYEQEGAGELLLPEKLLKDDEGLRAAIWQLLHELLLEPPAPPVWSAYNTLASTLRIDPDVKAFGWLPVSPGQLTWQEVKIKRSLAKALLGEGDVRQAVAVLQELLVALDQADAHAWTPPAQSDVGLELARLGLLDENDDWFDFGIDVASAAARQGALPSRLDGLLLERGDGEQAEALLVEKLGRALTPDKRRSDDSRVRGSNTTQDLLTRLAGVYSQAGRHEDVLKLVESAPWWNAADLAEIYTQPDARERPLGYLVAAALVAANRPAEAQPIIAALFASDNTADYLYELLIRLDANVALAELERQRELDPCEDRPLIWKAKLLLSRGELEAAEQAARQALALDPADAEQDRGGRLAAYGALADILTAQGKPEEAAPLRRKVEAARLADEADKYRNAGFKRRAEELVVAALETDDTLYWIHCQRALDLNAAGDPEQAQRHCARAAELWPGSMGALGEEYRRWYWIRTIPSADAIAEEAYLRRLEQRPDDHQAHYLLGRLRAIQGRSGEAKPCFEEAVRLSPDFLAAWRGLESGSGDSLASQEAERLTLAICRLDPLGRHGGNSLGIRKLAAYATMWNVTARAAALYPAPVEKLLPLPAAAPLAERRSSSGERPLKVGKLDEKRDPAVVLWTTDALQKIRTLIAGER